MHNNGGFMKENKRNKSKNTESCSNVSNSLTGFYIAAVLGVLPLFAIGGYSNITQTKSKLFYVVTIIYIIASAVVWLFSRLADKKSFKCISIKPDVIDISVASFGAVAFFSAILSDYQRDVWLGENSRYQGCLTILLYVVVFFVISRNFSFTNSALIASVTAFTFVCLIGIFNCFDIDVLGIYSVIGDSYKTICISTIGNINFYSSYICLLFPFVICGFCQAKEKLSVIIYLTAIVVGTLGAMMTSSESFMVGFILSIIIVSVIFLKDADKTKRLIFALGLILVIAQIYRLFCLLVKEPNYKISDLLNIVTNPIVTAVLLVVLFFSYLIINRNSASIITIRKVYIILIAVACLSGGAVIIAANTILTEMDFKWLDAYIKFTADWGTDRGEIWRMCIDVYKGLNLKEKIFGTGPETLYRFINTSKTFEGLNLDQAHNEYLQHLLTIGLAGLMSYMSVIVGVCVVVFKYLKSDHLGVAVFAGLIAYWVQAFFNIAQPFTTPVMYIYVALIGGIFAKNKATKIIEEKRRK